MTGGRLAVERRGAGHPLLCLHGGPGLDSSTLSEREYTHERWASDVGELAAALGHARYALLGHSYGGFIALEHAVRRPDAVERLVPVGSSAGPVNVTLPRVESDAALRALTAERWPRFFAGADAHTELLERIRFSAGPHNAAFGGALSRYDLSDAVGALETPVLLVVGARDGHREPMERLATRLPRAALHVVAGAGHFPFVEAPAEFTDVVGHFLSSSETAERSR